MLASISPRGSVSIWIENSNGEVVYRNSIPQSVYHKSIVLLKGHFTLAKGYRINTLVNQSRGMLLSINNGR